MNDLPSQGLAESTSSLWRDAWIRLRRNRLAVFGACVLVLMGGLSIIAPWIAPYGYETQNLELKAVPPQLSWNTMQAVYGRCTLEQARTNAEQLGGALGKIKNTQVAAKLHGTIDERDYGETMWVSDWQGAGPKRIEITLMASLRWMMPATRQLFFTCIRGRIGWARMN